MLFKDVSIVFGFILVFQMTYKYISLLNDLANWNLG